MPPIHDGTQPGVRYVSVEKRKKYPTERPSSCRRCVTRKSVRVGMGDRVGRTWAFLRRSRQTSVY